MIQLYWKIEYIWIQFFRGIPVLDKTMRLWIPLSLLFTLACLVQAEEGSLKDHLDYLAQADPEGLQNLKQEIDNALMKYTFNRPLR